MGSHYHFIETNRALSFDRSLAYGRRLDVPAGTAIRFEPGESKTISLVSIAGKKRITGGNGIASGYVNSSKVTQIVDELGKGAAFLTLYRPRKGKCMLTFMDLPPEIESDWETPICG